MNKFSMPIDGERGLAWLCENLAASAARFSVQLLPAAEFVYLDDDQLIAHICWPPDRAVPEVTVSRAWYLHAVNKSLWVLSHGVSALDLAPMEPDAFAQAYTDADRQVWKPDVVVESEGGRRVLVPRYFRMRKGIIGSLPALLDRMMFFVLCHECGHFVNGDWHYLRRQRGQDVHRDHYRADAGEHAGSPRVDLLRHSMELQADAYATMSLIGPHFLMWCNKMQPDDVKAIEVDVFRRHVELSFLALSALLLDFTEGEYHPSGQVRVLNAFGIMRDYMESGNVPAGVWSLDLAKATLRSLEELGALFRRPIPMADDIAEMFTEPPARSGRFSTRIDEIVEHRRQHEDALAACRRLAHRSIQERELRLG